MIKRITLERRRYPRIEKKLPLNVAANGYDFATVTQNISCIGAYCHVDKYIPPFTKIAIKMALPIINIDKPDASNIECKGVVVRTEDVKGGGFNIAIFFNAIENSQRKKISRYINQFLPKNPPS
jgi:c-di-GMP-binding flagellar brake protein YcgR